MATTNPQLDTLKDIKQIMERSSRFISLSGLSGIAAGICALMGTWFARDMVSAQSLSSTGARTPLSVNEVINSSLFLIAIVTFIAALLLALLFTYLRSRKSNTPMWTLSSRRLIFAVSFPMVVGGIFILKFIQQGAFSFIAPACLIFYGLALVNAGKYTLSEVRYLGYGQILLGLTNLLFLEHGLQFWAIGFGVLHILYGSIMWWKYERN